MKLPPLVRLLVYTLSLLLLLRAEGLRAQAPAASPAWSEARVGAVTTLVVGAQERGYPQIPLLRLGSGEELRVGFDLLGGGAPLLAYRLELRGVNWQEAELLPGEWMQRAAGQELAPPRASLGTRQPYQHYELGLNARQFQRSGNYLLEIYELSSEHSLLRIPLCVYEQRLRLEAGLTDQAWMDSHAGVQQVELRIGGLDMLQQASLEDELEVVVVQNARWETARRMGTPSEQGFDALAYKGASAVRFPAGSGYYRVEHGSDRGPFAGVSSSYPAHRGLLGLQLQPQHSRAGLAYSYEQQRQGLQYLWCTEGQVATRGDYHELSFSLEVDQPLSGAVYLEGEAFRYLSLERRQLRYDASGRCYRISLPLKMGYQEYQFLYRPEAGAELQTAPLMGDHYQTENHYTVLVYQHGMMDETARLVAVTQL